MARVEQLASAAELLPESRIGVLVDIAKALARGVSVTLGTASDIVTSDFAEDFGARLVAYHAFNESKLTKKPFEFLFAEANRAVGRQAAIAQNSVNPGADVDVADVSYSLKTEGAQGMSRRAVTISKLMEARWIRECRTGDDFAEGVNAHVLEHLKRYARILVLRAFMNREEYEYQLYEIPLDVLRSVEGLTGDDFSARTANGSSSARVIVRDGSSFQLRLDGSVEKVTVTGLSVSLLIHHATWKVERRPVSP